MSAKFNIAEALLEENLSKRPDKTAIHHEGGQITYAELAERASRFANSLREMVDLRIGDKIMLVLPDSPEFFVSLLGSMKIGAVPVLTNAQLNESDYRYMFNLSRASTAVLSSSVLSSIMRILPDLRYLRRLIVVGDHERANVLDFDDLVRLGSGETPSAETYGDDPAFWLWTSGTTGSPQAVVHLHHDIMFTTEAFGKHILKLTDSDVCFSASKLHFAYGLGNSFSFPMRFGASVVLYPERPSPERLLELVDEYRPTVFFAVPTIYNALNRLGDDLVGKFDHSSLRLCASAGEALPAAVWNQWKRKFGVEILDGIGTTEILHCFISNREGMVKPGSSGLPVPGYDVKLVDEFGNELTGPGESGYLMVKGDSITPFYWLNQERTKKTILGDWIYTGDIFSRDEDGFYWHKGRASDMLKPRGLWVSPVEVEGALLEHEAVFECAVVGVRDEAGLEGVKAFIVLKQGYAPGPDLVAQMKGFLKERIDAYKVPQAVEFVPELPKTSTGKIRRFMLRGKGSPHFASAPEIAVGEKRSKGGGDRRGTLADPALAVVSLKYARLREVCRYQSSGSCTLKPGLGHDCALPMCELVQA